MLLKDYLTVQHRYIFLVFVCVPNWCRGCKLYFFLHVKTYTSVLPHQWVRICNGNVAYLFVRSQARPDQGIMEKYIAQKRTKTRQAICRYQTSKPIDNVRCPLFSMRSNLDTRHNKLSLGRDLKELQPTHSSLVMILGQPLHHAHQLRRDVMVHNLQRSNKNKTLNIKPW